MILSSQENNELGASAACVLAGENMLMGMMAGSRCGAVPLSAHIFVTIIPAQIKSHRHIEPG